MAVISMTGQKNRSITQALPWWSTWTATASLKPLTSRPRHTCRNWPNGTCQPSRCWITAWSLTVSVVTCIAHALNLLGLSLIIICFISVPSWARFLTGIMKPFLGNVLDRFEIFGYEDWLPALLERIDAQELPRGYGAYVGDGDGSDDNDNEGDTGWFS